MILVAGSTGVLGSEIVRRLLAQGQATRALVRSTSAPEKVSALEQAGAEVVRGDLKDRRSLDAAVRGVHTVISTVTTILTSQPGDSFGDTDGRGNIQLIDAAAGAGAKHFIFVSFDTSGVPDSPLTSAKRDVEDHLRRSGMTWTILQPSLFMESWLGPFLFADPVTGTAKIYGDGRTGIRYVAVADVAEVAVRSVSVPSARNAVISFGGPDAITPRDALRMMEQESGRRFEVTEIPEGALEAQWSSASDPYQKTFAALILAVARGLGSNIDVPPKELCGEMTPPRDFVRRAAAGAVTPASR
jgi:uncharacterized protein YbjT (DUF2867 family)